MAGGVETRTLSKSITEQLRLSDVEELNYIFSCDYFFHHNWSFYIINFMGKLYLFQQEMNQTITLVKKSICLRITKPPESYC